jgi:two-component system phosphate regulon response regulator PhoB
MAKTRVLVVEDDKSLSDVLKYNLEQAGCEIAQAHDGREALRLAQVNTPDLVVLDLMLPEIDGIEVCRRLRAGDSTRNLLILMLTAKAEEMDQIIGFSVGADDYVTKPFSVKVLTERVKALLRRRDVGQEDRDVIVNQGLMIDRRRHLVLAGDDTVNLTKSEFRLLEALMRQPGRVFSRAELIDSALGDDAIVLERTIDVHVRAVRKKLGPYALLIQTVRGVGYRFREARGDAE